MTETQQRVLESFRSHALLGNAEIECETALKHLHIKLFATAVFYQASSNLDEQRIAVIEALGSVDDFLKSQGFSAVLRDALMRPLKALDHRADNYVDPLFAERLRPGRPNRIYTDDYRTAVLAVLATVWLLVRHGEDMTEDQILKEAARKMSGGAWFGNVTASKLRTARELVAKSSKQDRLGTMARDYHARLGKLFGSFTANQAFALAIKYQNEMPYFDLTWGTKVKTPTVSSEETE